MSKYSKTRTHLTVYYGFQSGLHNSNLPPYSLHLLCVYIWNLWHKNCIAIKPWCLLQPASLSLWDFHNVPNNYCNFNAIALNYTYSTLPCRWHYGCIINCSQQYTRAIILNHPSPCLIKICCGGKTGFILRQRSIYITLLLYLLICLYMSALGWIWGKV